MDNMIKCEGELEFNDIDVFLGVVENIIDGGFLEKIKPKQYRWVGTQEIENQMKSSNDIISAVYFGDFSLRIGGCLYPYEFVVKINNILAIATKGFFLTQKQLNDTSISRWHDGKLEVVSAPDDLLDVIGQTKPEMQKDAILLDEVSWNVKYNHDSIYSYNAAREFMMDEVFMTMGNELSENKILIPSNTVGRIIKFEVAKKFFKLDSENRIDEAVLKYDRIVSYLAGEAGIDDIENIEFLEWLDDTTIDVILALMETEYRRLVVFLKALDALHEVDNIDTSASLLESEIDWELRGSVTADKCVLEVMRIP